MQSETDFRFRTGFEPHRPEEGLPTSYSGEDHAGSGLSMGFGGWLNTFRDGMSAACREARRSRTEGLTKRCYRD
jgi:hypothetical protein